MTIRAVHHLNCATMCPVAGRLIGQHVGLGRGRMISHCLLLETERDGLVLVDTGFGVADCERRTHLPGAFMRVAAPALDLAETAVSQIRALGLSPHDVRHVVVTHLDLDHAGGISDFPHAKIHLHTNELEAALAPPTAPERARYIPDHWAHGPHWEDYAEDGDTWRGLPAITRLRGLDADVGLIPLHGHTRGHSAIIARFGDRWLVHAGDAYFHHGSLTGGRVPFGLAAFERLAQVDGAGRRASLAALRQLHTSYGDLDIFCAHDDHELAALREAARAN